MNKHYFWSKVLVLFALMTFVVNGSSWAQVSQYGFLETSGTYAALAGGTNSTATGDDGFQNGIAIGFTFNYGGTNYDYFCISTNGWIRLGDAATTIGGGSWTNEINPAATAHEPLIAAFWDDNHRNTGSISYLMTGSAPNRVLEVNWNAVNIGGGGSTSAANTASYLLRIYETSNNVEIIYGTMNTAGALSASIGLADLTSYKSVTPGTTSTVSSSTPNNAIAASTNVVGKRYLFGPMPATPGALTQDPSAPTCSGGTTITAAGTPAANETWYWQTSATGTSMATPYSGPYAVFANGTYYLRAYNSATTFWSTNSSSITITNFPLASVPPAPTAAANPACVSTGTTLSMPAPPSGTVYYWQGTVANGSSNANDASTPYAVSATGTYHVAAYETATGCWSNTSSVMVTVDTYVPAAPTASPSVYNICSMTPSLEISATPPPGGAGGTVNAATGTISLAIPDSDPAGISSTLNISGVPAGGTVTAVAVNLNITHTFDADLDIFLIGPNGVQIELSTDNGSLNDNYTNTTFTNTASTSITLGTPPFTGTFLPEGDLTSLFSIPNGNWVLFIQDDLGGDFGTLTGWSIAVTYTQNPVSTIAWYDAASSGNNIGNGVPFETVGTTVMPNTNSEGSYTFYAASTSGGCTSTSTTPITVNVTEVLATLNPVNVTCNGGNNGSFTLGTVQCGDPGGNFLYSIDNGAFEPIPTDLTAGTYSIVIQDQTTMGESAPISLTLTQPAAPSALNVTNITYFNATLGWTTTGDETSWTVIYGETGFDPATEGTAVPGVSNPYTLDGVLEDNTTYDFYVFADCGALADTSGPVTFTTDQGFFTFDSQCGPGFTDISGSGTPLNLGDDNTIVVNPVTPLQVQGISSTNITISNNGFISWPGVVLNVWNLDLDSEEGNVYWQETTIGGDNYFIVQWDNRPRFSAVAGQTVTFQLLFNQTTGEFYYIYDDVVFGGTQSSNDFGGQGTISVDATTDVVVSASNTTYLTNNSCAHFYYALCPNITNFSSLVYPDEAQLSWNSGLYNETMWTIIYGEEGFDPATEGTTQIVSIPPDPAPQIALTGLEQNTTYDVYIYSECAADDLTSGGYLYTFTTLPFCSNPSALAGTTDVDSLELTWNWAPYFGGGYDIDQFNVLYTMPGAYTMEVPATGTNNADTIFDANLIAGGVYQVYVQASCIDVVNGGTDTSAWVGPITVVMPVSNDTVCGSEELTLGSVYTFNNTGAGVSLNETTIAPPATGAQTTDGWVNSTLNNTTWFTFTAPASGSVRINNTAVNYNGQLAVYESEDCGDFMSGWTLVAANDNEIDGTSLAPNFTICGLTPGAMYYVLHDGTGTTGVYSIAVTEIVLQAGSALPLTQICYGESIDLFTTISGNDTGGVWSAPVAAVNASISGSDFTSTGLAYQTFEFQYRMTDGCAYDSIVSEVQVFAPSSAGDDGTITVCKNEPLDLYAGLNGTVDHGGTWYNPSNAVTPSEIVSSAFAGSFNYDYITGNGVCPDDTSHVVVIVLSSCDHASVDEIVFEGVQLYPNPTTGIINIDADRVFEVEVTDANGRVIKKNAKTVVGTTAIDLGKVQVGMYFITLRNADASKVFRVVVE